MKTPLTQTNNENISVNDKVNTSDTSKSPNSSPRSSPRPSPRPQNKREHSKSDTLLTVDYREYSPTGGKSDGSPSSQDSLSVRGVEISTPTLEINKAESFQSTTLITKEYKKDTKSNKKKSSWFNSFYPTYKSRSGDFRRIFKEVPDDERLVVDYSCALQKEILVQGRLYVTQNYLCFYANIFGWETNVQLKWKDVSSITKEKTARLIPNAILICTRNEKYFFTSFVARDKTYLMLFRVWQNALMDQPMTPQEMWQWVHQCYGDELGLTSDDEDYIAPGTEEDKLSAKLSIESISEEICLQDNILENLNMDEINGDDISLNIIKSGSPKSNLTNNKFPIEMSDTTESDGEKQQTKKIPKISLTIFPNNPSSSSTSLYPNDIGNDTDRKLQRDQCDVKIQCTCAHDGRQLVNEIIPIHIDQLFTLLFTSSKFYLDFHASRKTTDLTQTPWTHNSNDNSKSRIVNSTVAINQTMGPKTAQVTETQVMLPCSKAGYLYAIDIDTVHAGIPYADSFNILVHCCMQKISENETSLMVFGQIKYKKSVWGLVKGMIEKGCWGGLEDFYSALIKSLHIECEESAPDVKRKTRRKRRIHSMPRPGDDDNRNLIGVANRTTSTGVLSSDVSTMIVFIVLILLVILNVLLYIKLWSLEETTPYTILDLHMLKDPPKNHDDWIKLLQQQENLHSVEIQKWQRILKNAIRSLKESEEALIELQRSINPAYTSKIASILQNQQNSDQTSTREDL